MQWEGVIEFVQVAETESFTKASKNLEISTAQVSRQIGRLEKRLKVKLFYRTTRKVSLTQEGQVFYQHCRSVLDGLNAAERAITHLNSKPQGKIKLTAPVTFGERHILPLVNDFVLKYPAIEVDANLTNQQLDLVHEGCDLAIRIGQLHDSTMMAKKLTSRTSFVCASPAYLRLYGTPHSLSELHNHNCLQGSQEFWHFIEAGKERNIRIRGRIRVNSGFCLADAALKGLGIVQLPDFYVNEHLASGDLVSILDKYRISAEDIWALYPHNRYLSPKISLLIDYLGKNLR